MRTFKDKTGASWIIEIDLSVVTAVKRATGINLVDLVIGEGGKGLADDPEMVGRLLWTVCEEQAQKQGIAPDVFPRRFNGEALDDAVDAISLAVADFLSPSRRELALKVIGKGKQVTTAALALAAAKVDGIDASRLVTTLSAGPTSSAASPGSTPAT